jgi:hypothetical protein
MPDAANPKGALSPAYESSETEFWYNVMPQAEMPIAGNMEHLANLEVLKAVLDKLAKIAEKDLLAEVASELLKKPEVLHDLRKLLGISDKRAYLELSYLTSRQKHPAEPNALCGCQPWTMARHPMQFFIRLLQCEKNDVRQAAADVMAKYLLDEGLGAAAKAFSAMSVESLAAAFENLIAPKELQQKAAKRRGHGCEGALAKVLKAVGAKMLPPDKAENPMGSQDPNVDFSMLTVVERKRGLTYSFDMIVLGPKDRVAVLVQSLIHTSDPGQYGVDKSNQTVEIAEKLRAANKQLRKPAEQVELWGLLDGVGFSENKKDTLNKMLGEFPCFLQLNTLYKAPLRLHQLGLCRVKAIKFTPYYSSADIRAITEKFVPKDVLVLGKEAPDPKWTAVLAGRATLYLE